MSNKLYEETNIQNIANSIRGKLGVSTTYKVSEMSSAIDSIPTGGEQPTLNAPTISISNGYLNIDNPASNGSFVSSYDLYNNQVFVANLTSTTVLLYDYITTESLTNSIQVKAKGTNFNESEFSNAENFNSAIGLGFNSTGGNTIQMSIEGTLTNAINMYYRIGSGGWTQWFNAKNGSSSTLTINNGETLYLWNDSNWFSQSSTQYAQIKLSGSGTIAISGAINCLVNAKSITNKPYCFYELFQGQTAITNISQISFPTLDLRGANNCYDSMFTSCKGITSIPSQLPAIILSDYCYAFMFWGCTGITSLNSTFLPSTILATYCYQSMFNGCTNLEDYMTYLPATTLQEGCYQSMFQGCTKLVRGVIFGNVRQHPTTIPKNAFLSMFYDCTALWNPVGFNAKSVGEYGMLEMFWGCTAMTIRKGSGGGSQYIQIWTVPSDLGTGALSDMFGGGVALENGATATPVAGDDLYRKG